MVVLMLCGVPCAAAAQSFSQGLWRSQDPRIAFKDGFYYSLSWENTVLKLYKHTSLVDRGVGKPVPTGFPLVAPTYVDTLGGQTCACWVALGDNVWTLPAGEDPYDNLDQWSMGPSTASPGSFDYALFQDPQAGPYQGRWYLVHAGQDFSINKPYGESIFISEVLSLSAPPILANPNNTAANRIVVPAYGTWMDIIAEAPHVSANPNGDLFLTYAGSGTQSDAYAAGVSVLQRGADPSAPASWMNHNRGACSDAVNTPALQTSKEVFGPGVVQLFASPDGSEGWMLYHSKTWSTGTSTNQNLNEMYNRYISLQKFTWAQPVVCNGNTYNFPFLGVPQAPGATTALPSGDPGVTDRYVKIEAEAMISLGYVLGSGVQSLPRQCVVLNNPSSGLNPEVIALQDPNCSNGAKVSHFFALAQDQSTLPNRSGLVWRNAPQANYLAVTLASATDANLDLWVDGSPVGQLNFAASGGNEVFQTYQFLVNIAHGDEVRLVFERGRSVDVDIDYIELSPTLISVAPAKDGGTTASPAVIPSSTSSTGTTGGGSAASSTGTSGGTAGSGGTSSSSTSGTGLLPPPSSNSGGSTGSVAEPEQVSQGGCNAAAGAWAPAWIAWLWAQRRRRG